MDRHVRLVQVIVLSAWTEFDAYPAIQGNLKSRMNVYLALKTALSAITGTIALLAMLDIS